MIGVHNLRHCLSEKFELDEGNGLYQYNVLLVDVANLAVNLGEVIATLNKIPLPPISFDMLCFRVLRKLRSSGKRHVKERIHATSFASQ